MISHKFLKGASWLVAVATMASGTSLVGALDEPFQQLPLELAAADFLPESVLSGEGYTVDERVVNDGVQNTYTLKSDYGELIVTGTGELLARIQEVQATRALEKLEGSDEFKEAAKGAVTGMVEGGKALWNEPVDTSKAAARGVGRWLSNIGSSITSDDPHQDNAFETAVGYDVAKRGYAVAMGVDPYTDFEPFQERLGEVASATAAGAMVTSMAIKVGTAGSIAGTVATVTRLASMQNLLKDNPPSTLTKLNRETLLAMGIVGYQADALLKNYNYTPAEMTMICEALKWMGDIEGREIFVAYATSAPDREVAQFTQHYAEMLSDYITTVASGDIVDVAGTAWLVSRSGSLVGAFPIDYLAWTKNVADSTGTASEQMVGLGAKRKELLLKGRVSPVAKAALESRGWEITENVRLASAADSTTL
ncbi:MAG: hypothetical protein DRR04_01935 [Gammaproteobacteria bacterium]|nr:MAG: hypothetical protein DRQ97_01195 [Gammaproteobacteria bacterium]RLA61827.1 MAG: hypothetical protein DRR04_01935 [Gammaproteobacteria bacterium]